MITETAATILTGIATVVIEFLLNILLMVVGGVDLFVLYCVISHIVPATKKDGTPYPEPDDKGLTAKQRIGACLRTLLQFVMYILGSCLIVAAIGKAVEFVLSLFA